MSARHAGRRARKPRTYSGRNGDVSSLSPGTNRNHSTKGVGGTRSRRRRRIARHARNDARDARALALIQRNSAHDYLSSRLLATEPIAARKKKGLGRHAPGSGTTWCSDYRKTASL